MIVPGRNTGMTKNQTTASRRAFIAPLLATAVLLFLAVLTIIVDGGRMIVSESELQGLSQVVALTAATAIDGGEEAVKNNVDKFFQLNNVSGCSYKLKVDGAVVVITLTRTVPLLLSKRVGFHSYTVVSAASATTAMGKVRLVQ